jgi:glycosyltransferase involved in cell wall biosynthesis
MVTLDSNIEKLNRVSEGGLKLYVLPERKRARHLALSFFSQEITYLEGMLREIKPDIVHAHWTYEFAEAALRSELPHLVTMHDSPLAVFALYRDAFRFFRLLMALRTIPRIKSLAVVSPFLIRHARMHGYFRAISVVPNGVPIPALTADKPTGFRNPVRIVTVGDTGRLKNVQAAVLAFTQIRERFPDAELHLFGPGLDETFCPTAVNLYRHGSVPHATLMQYLEKEATLLIHPSLQESFGVILVEGMASGVPSIAGRTSGGVPYVLGPELGRMLVNVRDPERIAKKAIEVLTDQLQYTRLSEMARSRAKTMFSQRDMALNYLDIYSAILTDVTN